MGLDQRHPERVVLRFEQTTAILQSSVAVLEREVEGRARLPHVNATESPAPSSECLQPGRHVGRGVGVQRAFSELKCLFLNPCTSKLGG